MLDRARRTAADEVVLDLEDSVSPGEKDAARQRLAEAIPRWDGAAAVSVRINAPGTPWSHTDVITLASLSQPPANLVVPKVESPGDLHFIDRLLAGIEAEHGRGRVRTHALIESARGLSALREIASCSDRLEALVIGYADLAASLGRKSGGGDVRAWDAARQDIVTAARANDLYAIDGPYLGIHRDEGFRAETLHARRLGLDGKWAIHPAQLEAINELFSPTPDEIAQAKRIVQTLDRAALDRGKGAVALDGQMLDRAVELAARRTLEAADQQRLAPDPPAKRDSDRA